MPVDLLGGDGDRRLVKRVVAFVTIVTMLGLVAIGVVASLAWRDESLRRTGVPREVLWHHVEAAPSAVRRTEKFTVRRAVTVDLRSPGWIGTLTMVALRVGDVLDPTSPPPFTVDGIARPWFPADAPLYRGVGVGVGAAGADVDDLGRSCVCRSGGRSRIVVAPPRRIDLAMYRVAGFRRSDAWTIVFCERSLQAVVGVVAGSVVWLTALGMTHRLPPVIVLAQCSATLLSIVAALGLTAAAVALCSSKRLHVAALREGA